MMEPLFEYLLKSSGILAIFYAVYYLFLQRETLFRENRRFLLFGLLCALGLPLVSIPVYVEVASAQAGPLYYAPVTKTTAEADSGLDLWSIAAIFYLTGVFLLFSKFIFQLWSLRSTLQNAVRARKEGKINYLETDRAVAPFSFFNYIVYNPSEYNPTELEAILAHEKAHCRQRHSLDVLLSQMLIVFLWINPLSFLYQKTIRENLEFLADASATDSVKSKKGYQYTMLKVSGQQVPMAIINHFYNSLIKKRIVMLQKSQSKKTRALKAILVLPALALFLFSFNTREIYIPANQAASLNWWELDSNKEIKLQITKDTSDDELEKMKKDMAEEGVDFSYTVVRNEKKEIIEMFIDMHSQPGKEKKLRGSSEFENGGEPIDPVIIVFDPDGTMMFLGNENNMLQGKNSMKNGMILIMEEDEEMTEEMLEKMEKEGVIIISVTEDEQEWTDEKGNVTKKVRIKKGEDEENVEHIIIKKVGDQHTDGEMEIIEKMVIRKMGKKGNGKDEESKEIQVEVITSDNAKGKNVFIMKDSDEEADIEIIEEDGGGFFFIDGSSGDKPLYMIDGKKVNDKAIKSLSPKDIAEVNVLKGDAATKKYGKEGKDGVVEITTKKN